MRFLTSTNVYYDIYENPPEHIMKCLDNTIIEIDGIRYHVSSSAAFMIHERNESSLPLRIISDDRGKQSVRIQQRRSNLETRDSIVSSAIFSQTGHIHSHFSIETMTNE